ncbi:MAG: hypothetical protein ACLFSZ_09310 [Puniceicoccaceae bacterium]
MRAYQYLRIGLLGLTASAVLHQGLFALDYAEAKWIQAYFGYYFCLGALGLVVASCYLDRGALVRTIFHGPRGGIMAALAVALGATFLTGLHEPSAMRVFNDEPSHLTTAKAMADSRGTYSPGVAFHEAGGYAYGRVDPVYRMYLYPFAVSILHNLTGTRIENAYALNAAAAFATFFLVFFLGRKTGGGAAAGFCAQMLLLTSPLLQQVVNSAAYDPLNLAVLAAYALGCIHYARCEGVRGGMNVCLSLGLLLSFGRSESILFLLVFVFIYLYKCWRHRRIDATWMAVCSPLFLIGPFSGRIIAERLGTSFDKLYETKTGSFFGAEYVLPNIDSFLSWCFSTNASALNSYLLSLLFAILVPLGFVFAIGRYLRNRRRRAAAPAGGVETEAPGAGGTQGAGWILAAFWVVVVIHTGIIAAHFWSPVESSAVRFFLPFTLFAALAVVWAFGRAGHLFFPRGLTTGYHILAGVAFLFFWSVTLPKGARAEATFRNVNGQYARESLEWALANDDGRTLYVVRMLDLFILHELPVMSLQSFYAGYDGVDALIAEDLYERVLVLDFEYYNPRLNTWDGPIPRIPDRDEIEYETIETWRGFIHAELSIRKVIGWRTDDGDFIPLGEKNTAEVGMSDAEYYERIRDLRGARQQDPSE